jgi:3-deoxy-manno-octulosonate cytidylyltransferase (CMP-KDO synthetase)
LVCADDEALVEVVGAAGFQAVLTGTHHQSGTDRIAEAVAQRSEAIIVNVQGDEPEIDAEHICRVAGLLQDQSDAPMATLATHGDASDQADPNVVKLQLSADQRALTFTRAPMIWDRDAASPRAQCHRHLGIYAYRRQFLLDYHALPPSEWERTEKLEQLRAIEAGYPIACAVVANAAPGIDSRADYDAFLARTTLSLAPAPAAQATSEM